MHHQTFDYDYEHRSLRWLSTSTMESAQVRSYLRYYRPGGHRAQYHRDIFRHHTRVDEPFKTGGSANILWLDGHVSSQAETTGNDIAKRWYTGP